MNFYESFSMNKFNKPKKSFLRRIIRFFLKTVLIIFLLSVFSVIALKWIDPLTSSIMVQRKIEAIISDKKNKKIQYEWYDYNKIAKKMALAVIAAEDQNFPFHFGFDIVEIEKAIDQHNKGRRLRGASTITQQVAKNLFLWEKKNFIRKGFEAYFTLLIEVFWSKERILEVYLNIAEMGDMIFGVGAASKIYYKKEPRKLSASEAALLTAALPNPKRYSIRKASAFMMMRQQWILSQMSSLGGIAYLNNL
jgi:monofunctional biosynthetic peptidoglycan transglycosylase